jgi:hypothetical protein
MYQGIQLLPEERGKNLFFIHCMACHGFETRMAAVKRNEDGWRDRVNYMREAMAFFMGGRSRTSPIKKRRYRSLHEPRVRRGVGVAALAR